LIDALLNVSAVVSALTGIVFEDQSHAETIPSDPVPSVVYAVVVRLLVTDDPVMLLPTGVVVFAPVTT
jgi:hypothetical protein